MNSRFQVLRGSLVMLLAVACVTAGVFRWRQGVAVVLPDAPSQRIACVSYAPFHRPGETPLAQDAFVPPQRIEKDLRMLSKRFDCVRIYSVGQGLSEVPQIAKSLGMEVMLGIWIGRDREENEREVALGIRVANENRDAVRAVIVGNEVLLRNELPAVELKRHIERVGAAIALPVTYADMWGFWIKHREVADAVSFITIHILPYWEDDPVGVDDAVAHVDAVYSQIKKAFPKKEVVIGETGWPSAGRQRRHAVPSLVNEARFFREFLRYAAESKVPYNVIEAFDQPWKRQLEGTVGGYWGLYGADLRPKFPLQGPVIENSDWRVGIYVSVASGLVFLGASLARGRRTGVWGASVLLLGGCATGGLLIAQLRNLMISNRNALEWAVTGSYTFLAFVTAVALCTVLAHWADRRGPVSSPASLADIVRAPNSEGLWLGLMRFAWLFAAAVVCLLLTFDARYRDFPLSLFTPPLLGFALLALLAVVTGKASKAKLEERILAGWLAAAAPILVAMEHVSNTSALIWAGLCLLFAAAVLIPGRTPIRGA